MGQPPSYKQDGRKPGDRPLVACPLFYALGSGSRAFGGVALTPAACLSAVVIFGSPSAVDVPLLCGLRYVSLASGYTRRCV